MKWLSRKTRPHPAATFVHLKPSIDVSFIALVYCGATLFIGVAAMNSQTNLLFGVLGMMMGVLLVAAYISRTSIRKLSVHRSVPDHLVVGDPATLVYTLSNGKRYWPSISVSMGELDGCEGFVFQPYGYLLHAPAGSSKQLTVPLMPKRRGIHELDRYQLSTSFPFGFVKRATLATKREAIMIFPALAQVSPAILMLCQSAENAGARMRPRRGGDDEFYGLREYRVGENPRMIHWKLSAHSGDLVMREMTRVSPPRLMIVLDNYCAYDDCNLSDTELTIAMAASLASLALGRGYPVGLLSYSGNYVHVAPDHGKRHRRELLSQIAQLQRNSSHAHARLVDAASMHVAPGTSIILMTPAWTAAPAWRPAGRIISLCTRDQTVRRYFTFRDGIDFAHSMPVDQENEGFRSAQPELFQTAELPEEAAGV